jgi:hypothetical protein
MTADPTSGEAAIGARILQALPGRAPGRQVTAIAAELGADVHEVQAELLDMERTGRVLRGQRRGSQRWYRGVPAQAAAPCDDQAGLW